MSAEESAVPATPQQTTEPAGIYDDIPDNRPLTSDFAAEIDRKLGIPSDLRTGFSQENPTSEAEPAPQEEEQPAEDKPVEEASADESEKPETEEGQGDEETGDDEEPKQNEGEDTQVYKARRGEWRQRKRAQRAEKERDELRERLAGLEGQQPVVVQPTMQDPLAHIETLDALAKELNNAEITLDFLA